FLSIHPDTIPPAQREKDVRTYRSLTIQDEAFDFSDGFTDLHTKSYEQILAGKGFTMEDARKSIEIIYHIRNSEIRAGEGDSHPLVALGTAPHPFSENP